LVGALEKLVRAPDLLVGALDQLVEALDQLVRLLGASCGHQLPPVCPSLSTVCTRGTRDTTAHNTVCTGGTRDTTAHNYCLHWGDSRHHCTQLLGHAWSQHHPTGQTRVRLFMATQWAVKPEKHVPVNSCRAVRTATPAAEYRISRTTLLYKIGSPSTSAETKRMFPPAPPNITPLESQNNTWPFNKVVLTLAVQENQ
jgi:hypothetical protein